MSLENFKNRKIEWDTVNKNFEQSVQIVSGDVNSRTVTIVITDNGEPINLTGYSVKLIYKYIYNDNSGFVMLTPTDAEKGEFSLTIPTEMTSPGSIKSNLILLNENLEQVIVSKNLKFISDDSTVTDLAQEVNSKIDDFTKLLLENMPQVMRSELNDLHAQTESNTSNIDFKANSSDMTSLQSAMNNLQSKVEAFGITPENLVTIKSLLDAITNNATDSEVAELINSVNILTSNISLMSGGDYSPKANKTDLESLQSVVNNQSATISTKANKTDLDNLQTDVTSQGVSISKKAEQAEIIKARGGQSSLDVRLDGLDTKYTDLENKTTAQLAQKANLSEVRKNTMLQPITMAELSTEVKSGMTGGSVAVVGSNSTGKENIKTKAVTQGKTDFVKHGKNYFNKVKIVNGQYRSYTNGSLVTDALQFYSDYIEVDGGLTYTVNKPYTHICFYDDNYVFISGYLVNNTEASKTFTTPTNCRKLIVSTRISESNALQLEEGNTVTSFEEYSIFIDDLKVKLDKVIGKVTENKIEDRVITPLKTTFLTTGKNLLNKEKTTDNYRIAYNGGVKVADNNYAYTEHIAVVSGQTYVFNINFSHVCFYDKNYNYLSGLIVDNTVRSFTVPDNAIRVIISFSKNLKSRAQLEIGAVSTSYENYYLRFVYDSAPIDMRLIEPYPAFTKPYVFDKKLYTNGSGKPRTAVYTGVDAKVVPKGMRSKIRFLPGSQQGTVALISNQNGLTTVKNITDKSLHIVFTQSNANIGIFYGNGLKNLKTVNYNELCKVDGETEYEIGWSVEGNTISVTTPEGEVTTVTDDRIPLVMGKYCTFEHYWDGAMAARPIFSYFEVTDNTDTPIITDDFNIPDGEIATAPTGQSYTMFHI